LILGDHLNGPVREWYGAGNPEGFLTSDHTRFRWWVAATLNACLTPTNALSDLSLRRNRLDTCRWQSNWWAVPGA